MKPSASPPLRLLLLAAALFAALPAPAAASAIDDVLLARTLGDDDAERIALRAALAEVGERSSAAYPLHERLRALYSDAGEFAQAIATTKRQLEIASSPGQRLGPLIALASLYGGLHQMDQAHNALAELEQVITKLRSTRRWATSGAWWQAGLAKTKASLAMQAGQLEKAEDGWRACLSSAEAALKEQPEREGGSYFVDCNRGLLLVLMAHGQLAAAGQVADQLRMAAERMVEVKQRSSVRIRVNQTLGTLAMEQGKLELAEKLLRESLTGITAAGSSGRSVRGTTTYKLLAQLEMLRGNWPAALDWHGQRAALVKEMGDDRGQIGPSNPEYGYTLLRVGQTQEALSMLRRVAKKRDELYAPDALAALEAHAFLGLALYASGDLAGARRELQSTVPKILEVSKGERSSSDAGVLRTARLNWLLDGYIAVLAEYASGKVPGTGNAEMAAASDEAFRMADLARASTVQSALAASASRARISDPALAELARQEQDLQRELSALADAIGNLLSRGRVAEQDGIVANMRAQLASLRTTHAQTLGRIEARFPDYAALLNPRPVGIAAVQALLKPGEAVLSLYTGSERSVVWAIPAQGQPVMATVALPRAELEQKVASLRAALDPAAEVAGDLPRYPFALSHELYAALLAPVAAGWQDARELIVIAHGRLGQLPLSVLTTGPFHSPAAKLPFAEMAAAPWLIKRVGIAQLPAAIALPALRSARRDSVAPLAFAGFGDPLFSAARAKSASSLPSTTRGTIARRSLKLLRSSGSLPDFGASINFALLPPLPDTALEINEVATVLAAERKRDVFLQRRASEAVVKATDLSPYRVLMFATHGLTSGEMPGIYQPALALSNPALTGEGDGEDGLLTMEEILGLRLNAEWVVLSACNSGAAGGQSNESVSGLGRAFFYAGAQSLLVTNWSVETESARLLTTEAFRRQAAEPGLSRALALQQSSLALMTQSAGKHYSYAHPMFWAPYTLVGR